MNCSPRVSPLAMHRSRGSTLNKNTTSSSEDTKICSWIEKGCGNLECVTRMTSYILLAFESVIIEIQQQTHDETASLVVLNIISTILRSNSHRPPNIFCVNLISKWISWIYRRSAEKCFKFKVSRSHKDQISKSALPLIQLSVPYAGRGHDKEWERKKRKAAIVTLFGQKNNLSLVRYGRPCELRVRCHTLLGSAERGYIISGSVAGTPLDGDTFGGFIFRETWIVGTQGLYVRSRFYFPCVS